MTKSSRDKLETTRALLQVREADIDRLNAKHDADFMLLHLLLKHGQVAAAEAIILRKLGLGG